MKQHESDYPLTGRTLPSLLDEACERYANEHAFADVRGDQWTTLSNRLFRSRAQELAAGLLQFDVVRGDRVALFMRTNVDFMLVDMACAMAGLVTVPIYLTSSTDVKREILGSSEPRVVAITDDSLYASCAGLMEQLKSLNTVMLAEELPPPLAERSPFRPKLTSLSRIAAAGRKALDDDPELLDRFLSEISPSDILTIIYTSGTTGRPKGVVLTHENVTFDALSAYSGLVGLRRGDKETMLSFLPMTHVFARTLNYGAMNYGFSLYFSDPDSLAKHLLEVRPTIMATVPRVLEKVYEKIVARGTALRGVRGKLFTHALDLANDHRIGAAQSLRTKLDMKVSDQLVFRKWRAALGGRIRFIISGGAALDPHLNHIFGAAGLTILQGYGLTETSPVISFNRPADNRPGTVGVALQGVEIRIAGDGEILTRGPHVMEGYYRSPKATRKTIDPEGWLHTGDLGRLSRDGFLTITGRTKAMFKLSTGKWVVPQPIERNLAHSPLIDYAIMVGSDRKYCVALILVNEGATCALAADLGLDPRAELKTLLEEEDIVRAFQLAVDEANEGIAHWEQVKRFKLLDEPPTTENGLLTPTLKIRRIAIQPRFSDEIEALYVDDSDQTAADPPSKTDRRPVVRRIRAFRNRILKWNSSTE